MPERYLKIKESLKAAGKGDAEAKRIAAATFNKTRGKGEAPVTGKAEGGPPKRVGIRKKG